jgi:ectoine hydroxylase-related dioxygenase (phytanoyl-CoA dioxygenase family)
MGRGTHELLTAWTPLGDIPFSVGGLMVLENSHRRTDVTGEYLAQDVDTYCENGPNAEPIRAGKMGWEDWKRWQEPQGKQGWDGQLTYNPVQLREQLGGRWLTSREYRMGDVLIFTMRTVHASIDNQTRAIRLSSDSRYQPESLPVDERWVGESPVAHGLAGKRGKIC